MKLLQAVLLCVITFSLSSCMVINNVSEISPNDASPYSDRAIVVMGLGWDAGHSASAISVSLYKFALGTNHKFKNDCFFSTYDLIRPWSPPKPEKQHFVFSVTPGYYVYEGSDFNGPVVQFPRTSGEKTVFKVAAGEVNYLGDFVQSDKEVSKDCPNCEPRYAIELRQELQAANNAIKNYKSIKKDAIVAEQVVLEGQRVPVPMCSM